MSAVEGCGDRATQPGEIGAALGQIADVLDEFDRASKGDPPFFRGEKGEWDAAICDRILTEGPRKDDACDEPGEYLIEWRQQPYDAGTIPVSGSCEAHALDVDRSQVVRISTHPALAGSS